MRIELEISKKKLAQLGLTVLLIVLLAVQWFVPYFEYGTEAVMFTPEEGKVEALPGAWSNGLDPKKEGYIGIVIRGKKDITVTRRVDGELIETPARYKYSRGSQTLTFIWENAQGEEVSEDVALFDPVITFGGRGAAPMMQYVAAPFAFAEFKEELLEENPDYFINEVAVVPLLICLLAILLAVFSAVRKASRVVGAAGMAYSVFAAAGYCLNDLLKAGAGRTLHLVLLAAIFLWSLLLTLRAN